MFDLCFCVIVSVLSCVRSKANMLMVQMRFGRVPSVWRIGHALFRLLVGASAAPSQCQCAAHDVLTYDVVRGKDKPPPPYYNSGEFGNPMCVCLYW